MQLKPSAEEGLHYMCVTTIEFVLDGKEKINYDDDWTNRKRKLWLDNNIDTSSHFNEEKKKDTYAHTYSIRWCCWMSNE